MPDLVVRLTTPPLNRPNSAGGLLLSILNSWIASMIGKYATCPGSGCSTEMPSKRYSLVRGRPPLMRGRTEFGGSATPGAMRREHDEQAAVQRQLHDLLVLDDRPEARGLRSHDRRVCDDRHLFANVADAEIEIDARLLAGRQADALAAHGLEAGELDVEAVFAGRQARGRVDAVAGGHDHSLPIRACFGDGDGRAGNGGPGLILHDAGDLAGTGLGMLRATRRHTTRTRRQGRLKALPFESYASFPPQPR